MKITCAEYAGFKSVVTELTAPTKVFYLGDASSTLTTLIIAYYSASPFNVAIFKSTGGVLISTVTTDYPAAVRIAGLLTAEI